MAPAYKIILDAKEKREKGLKLKLSNAQQRIQECRNIRRAVLREYRDTLSQLGGKRTRSSLQDQKGLLNRLRGYRYEIRQYAGKLSSLEREKQEIREKLQKVARSRKLLEDHIEELEEEKREEHGRAQRKAAENYAIYNYSMDRDQK